MRYRKRENAPFFYIRKYRNGRIVFLSGFMKLKVKVCFNAFLAREPKPIIRLIGKVRYKDFWKD